MKCYVCVLSTNNYLEGVLVLKENLDNLKSKYKLLCLINEDITIESRNILSSFGIEYIEFPHITFDDVNYDNIYIFDKLNIFRLTDYDKIVYLDSDFLILESLDHLFRKDTLSMPRDLLFNFDEFSSGLMVVKPNMNDYNNLVRLAKEKNEKKVKISVQDVINEYFCGNIKCIDKEYNVVRKISNEDFLVYNPILNKVEWQPTVFYHLNDVDNPKIIHYIGKVKPFMLDRSFDDNYSHLYMFYLTKVREKINIFKKNNSGDLISVIIPIYNKEKYLKRCLDSVINQTYKNLEIILVDDKSSDKCLDICHEYGSKDSRIKVIENSENGGVSYTRNVGIDNANGKYISFIDADDYIEENMIEVLHYKCEIYDADFAQCSINYEDASKSKFLDNDEVLFEKFDLYRMFFYDIISCSSVDKLINRKLFDDGLRFDERFRKNEDTFFIIKLLEYSNTMCLVSTFLYNYADVKASLTEKFDYELDKNLLFIYHYLESYISNYIPNLIFLSVDRSLNNLYYFFNSLLNNPEQLKIACKDAEFEEFLIVSKYYVFNNGNLFPKLKSISDNILDLIDRLQ